MFSVYAEEIDTRRHIEVSGTAKILVEPDIAKWNISMRGEAGSIEEASKQLKESVNGLIESMKSAGFEIDMLSLSSISSGRHYEGSGDRRVFKGFYTQRTAVVELKDLTKRQSLEEVLLKDDQIKVSRMIAESSKHEEWRRKSLLKAAEVGKEKASELAKTLGGEIGALLSLNETPSGYGGHNMRSNSIHSMESSGTAELEKLTYEAKVTVKFALK